MKIKDLVKITNAKILKDINLDLDVKISTDTRTIESGDFYLPLKGASFDGEKFIDQAIEKGAIGAFSTTDNGTLQVEDTLKAYLQLANYRRNKLNLKVVAITGSSGKTTTKEIIASVLNQKYKTFKTPLNHNNEIGFCQTIFETPDDTEILVLEMGMRGLGEIELLSKYAEPDITVISNVGTAHIGRLGSRENIAKAKCEIVKFQRGSLFIGIDDELIRSNLIFDKEKIFYSLNDVKILEQNADYSKFEYLGSIYELNVGGNYNIENSLAAINVAMALGLSITQIQQGLREYKPIEKRWEATKIKNYEIINDSYNANPESMRAFIDTVFEFYKDFIVILGDMGELGDKEVEFHRILGQYINTHKYIDTNSKIFTVGELAKNISNEITKMHSLHFENIVEVVNYIQNNEKDNIKLFLKASRSMKFEDIIEKLAL